MCPVVDFAHLSLCIIVTMEEDLKLAVVDVKLIFDKSISRLPDIAQKWFCTCHEHMDLNFQMNWE